MSGQEIPTIANVIKTVEQSQITANIFGDYITTTA